MDLQQTALVLMEQPVSELPRRVRLLVWPRLQVVREPQEREVQPIQVLMAVR